jgi:hypothetical protein
VSLSNGAGKRIPQAALAEGHFLDERIPFKAFVTLTFVRDVSTRHIDGVLAAWIAELQKHNRATLGWIRAIEPSPRRHVHLLLATGGALDRSHAERTWRHFAGGNFLEAARVEPYVKGLGGGAYVLKMFGHNYEDVRFSENLSAFDPEAGTRFFGTTPRQRRQIRRIQAQRQSGHKGHS